MKIKYFYSIYGELEMHLQKRIPLGDYVYILNISGTDICKIGSSSYIFERVKQLRQVIKCIFPYIENSITYNVYISSPLKDNECKRNLEKELHNIFRSNKIDGEWFKCEFSDVIMKLREKEFDYMNKEQLLYILNLFDDNIYNEKVFFDNFFKLKYLKPLKNLGFKDFVKSEYPSLLKENKSNYIEFRKDITPDDVICILKNFVKYIKSDKIPKSKYNNIYSYKKQAIEKITIFIDNYASSIKT